MSCPVQLNGFNWTMICQLELIILSSVDVILVFDDSLAKGTVCFSGMLNVVRITNTTDFLNLILCTGRQTVILSQLLAGYLKELASLHNSRTNYIFLYRRENKKFRCAIYSLSSTNLQMQWITINGFRCSEVLYLSLPKKRFY